MKTQILTTLNRSKTANPTSDTRSPRTTAPDVAEKPVPQNHSPASPAAFFCPRTAAARGDLWAHGTLPRLPASAAAQPPGQPDSSLLCQVTCDDKQPYGQRFSRVRDWKAAVLSEGQDADFEIKASCHRLVTGWFSNNVTQKLCLVSFQTT